MDTQELQRIKNKYDIIGNDPELNRAIEMAVAVAPTDLTVLVTGESGVGKDNIPKIIHQNSLRKNAKYFAVNCGAIPEGTIDSELFGHEKGSFTGAIEARKGYFEEADGGTLFLDEVGELPLSSQAKLLRVLQSGEYIRVGSSKVGKTDVRVIAATNVDLYYAVSQGKFREDLYYRLNAIQIPMPALRDRKSDIYLLFRKFTSDFSEKYGIRKVGLTHDAIEMLTNYRWPGNIRQLKNIAETISALESGRITPGSDRCEINAETLQRYIPKENGNTLPVRYGSKEAISDSDKQDIYRALYALNMEVSNLKKILELNGLTHGDRHAGQESRALPSAPVTVTPDSYVSKPDETWQHTRDLDIDIQEPTVHVGSVVSGDSMAHSQDYVNSKEVAFQNAAENFSISQANQDLIRKALEKHGGNRKKAAEELGISERTLYRKLPPEFRNKKTEE